MVIDTKGDVVHIHLPQGRSGGALPDSSLLWEFLWAHRNDLSGVAHSHPGSGIPGPSFTDLTTFAAIEDGLGARLTWWITSSDHSVCLKWSGPGRLDYAQQNCNPEPAWMPELRRISESL